MHIPYAITSCLLLLWGLPLHILASSWGFEDATVSIQGKKASGGSTKEKLSEKKALSTPLTLGASDTLKIILTTKEDSKAKRPHQTFLNIRDPQSQLETSFALQVKESGKGKLELTQKDIPYQLLSALGPLDASLIIASFGRSTPYKKSVFDLKIDTESDLPSAQDQPLRYGKLPEIHHTFKSDPTSPSKIVTLIFTAAVVMTLPALLIVWASLGANLNHLSTAFGSAPIPHTLFFGSIVAMEVIFFMYYTSWNLFQTLPAGLGIGLVTFLSGSRALREVQQRRLAGLR